MNRFLIIYLRNGIENVGVFDGVHAAEATTKALDQWGLSARVKENCRAAPIDVLPDGWSYYEGACAP